MHPVGSLPTEQDFLLLLSFRPSDLLCLMSSRCKYNASTINYCLSSSSSFFFFFFFKHFDLKLVMEVAENACPTASRSSERYERDRTRSIRSIEVSYLVLAFMQPVILAICTSDLFPFLSVCTSSPPPPPPPLMSVCPSVFSPFCLSVPHVFSRFRLSALHSFFPFCLSVCISHFFPFMSVCPSRLFPFLSVCTSHLFSFIGIKTGVCPSIFSPVYLSLTSFSLSVCLPFTSFPFLSVCPSCLFPFPSVYPSHLFPFLSLVHHIFSPFCLSIPHIVSPFCVSVPHIFSPFHLSGPSHLFHFCLSVPLMDLIESHVYLKQYMCCIHIHECPRNNFNSDVSAHLQEHCVTSALINCLFVLIIYVCSIVTLICVCSNAKTGCPSHPPFPFLSDSVCPSHLVPFLSVCLSVLRIDSGGDWHP